MHGTQKPQAAGWKWKALLGTALAPLVLAAGCETHAGTGMLAGGAIGALAGGAIGAATHHAGTGALIGAAAGTAVGGLAGASEDHHERQQEIRAEARRNMGLQDVVNLTKDGTSDEIIMNQIRTSGTVFHLTGDEIHWLKQSGVRDCVIETMQATANQPPVVYMQQPPPPRVVFVEEAPRPPSVGVGFVFGGRR
jgi:outer membrane lipoprotein SlyB